MTVRLSVITDNPTDPASFEQYYGEHKRLATNLPNLQLDEVEALGSGFRSAPARLGSNHEHRRHRSPSPGVQPGDRDAREPELPHRGLERQLPAGHPHVDSGQRRHRTREAP